MPCRRGSEAHCPLPARVRCPEACVRGRDTHTAGRWSGGAWAQVPGDRSRVEEYLCPPSSQPRCPGVPPPPPLPYPQALVICLQVFSGRVGVFWSSGPCPVDHSVPGCRSACHLWAWTWEGLLRAPRVTSLLVPSFSGLAPHAEDRDSWPGPLCLGLLLVWEEQGCAGPAEGCETWSQKPCHWSPARPLAAACAVLIHFCPFTPPPVPERPLPSP